MANIIKIKTPYEQAEPAGKKLLAKAKEEYAKRAEDGKKSSYQAAKEAATYFVHKRNGRIMVTGGYTYCCFECLYHKSNIKVEGKSICVMCSNGSYFNKKGDN